MDQKKKLGQYPTPAWVAEALVQRHFPRLNRSDCIIEPSCGPGSFLAAVPDHVPAIGIDIDPAMAQAARQHTGREVLVGDFQTIPLDVQPTLILGNPPFNMKLVDGFLDRAHTLLPEGGKVAFILPTFAFQTASRVARYAERWSLMQEMIPRNIYPGLSLPLIFALLSKDRRRTMVGFALYRETADVLELPLPYRDALAASCGPAWRVVVETALERLGGAAHVQDIYSELERDRPTRTKFWREKIRQTLRRYTESFIPLGKGRYMRREFDVELAAAA